MAANHLQAKGLEDYEASRLGNALAEKLSIREPAAIDAFLEKYTSLDTPLSLKDWCSCFSKCYELLSTPPATVKSHLDTLWDVMDVSDEELVGTLMKTPSLLVHDPQDIGAKVEALQNVMALPEEEASAQLIIERFARHPAILARSVDALESQLDGLAQLLGTDIQRAARLAFKVPALAAQSNEELAGHVELLKQLLGLDTERVQALVLRQPSLLARTSEGLQSKIDAYTEMFGAEQVGSALSAAPQLLTMKVEAVKSRHELLLQLVQLVPAWQNQLEEASKETLAVWLCSSEKKLRRLEIAAENRRLSRMQLYRLLSNSESRWINDMAQAGLAPDGTPKGGQAAATPSTAGNTAEAPALAAAAAEGAKPKRPRGGKRERERKEKIAARQAAAAAAGGSAAAATAPGALPPPAAAAAAAAGGEESAAKPKRPRGGKRERERRERIARRQAAAEAAVAGTGGQHDDFGADYEPHPDSHPGAGDVSTAAGAGQQGNGVGGDAGAERPRRTRGGKREREKRERREARAAAAAEVAGSSDAGAQQHHVGEDFGAGFGRSAGADSTAQGGDGSGDLGGQKSKRNIRGGRKEREKRERLAARLAAATATAAATAALPQEA